MLAESRNLPVRYARSACCRHIHIHRKILHSCSCRPCTVQSSSATDGFELGESNYAVQDTAQPSTTAAAGGSATTAVAAAAEPLKVVGEPGASFGATVFNLVNVIMGAGYVSIPFACRQGGWVALAALWVLGAVFCYTGNTVLKCCEYVDQQRQQHSDKQMSPDFGSSNPPVSNVSDPGSAPPPFLHEESSTSTAMAAPSSSQPPPPPQAATAAGYEDVAEAAFGPLGRRFVSGVMYAELLGICCVYIVLEAEALCTLLSHTPLGMRLSSCLGPSAWVAAASALVVPTVLLPSVEALAALGAVGVIAAVTVGCVLAGLFISTPAQLTGLSDTALVNMATLPQVLGVLAFVYAGHSTFPVIQQSMADSSQGCRAVTAGYIATAAICTLIGGFGYAFWGPGTQQVVTANLATGSVLALLLTALTAVNPFSAFAVTLEPVALMLQRSLSTQQVARSKTDSSRAVDQDTSCADSEPSGGDADPQGDSQPQYPVRAAVRLGLALACCATAAVLPYVTDLMALVGALLTMTISLILPALMHLQLFKTDLPGWLVLLDCVVVLIGVACAVVGASSASSSLQSKLAGASCSF